MNTTIEAPDDRVLMRRSWSPPEGTKTIGKGLYKEELMDFAVLYRVLYLGNFTQLENSPLNRILDFFKEIKD